VYSILKATVDKHSPKAHMPHLFTPLVNKIKAMYSLCTLKPYSVFKHYTYTLADPGKGDPARAPLRPRTYNLFMPQTLNFFLFLFRSRFFLSLILIDIGPKHAKKLLKPSSPRSNPGSATCILV